MGGKSKSSSTSSQTQENTNIVNDGTFAGASNVNVDESDNSIEDSYNQETDNSVEDSYNTTLEDSYNTDNSVEDSNNTTLEDSYNTDNSVEDSNNTTLEDSYNTDNSVEDSYNTEFDGDNAANSGTISQYGDVGEQAFNSGTINNTVTDFGAIAAAENIADKALDTAGDAIKGVVENAKNGYGFAKDIIGELSDSQQYAIHTLGEQSEDYADNLRQAQSDFMSSFSDNTLHILNRYAQSQEQSTQLMRDIVTTEQTGGQNLVIDSQQDNYKLLGGLVLMSLLVVGALSLSRGKS